LAALFAHASDYFARQQADILNRTSENPSGARILNTRMTGGAFTGLQCACGNSLALRNVEKRFPGVLVRAIHDDKIILGDTESIFSEGGVRQPLATDLVDVGSEPHEGKAEAYGLTSSPPQSGRGHRDGG
jgi:hypothetical protein